MALKLKNIPTRFYAGCLTQLAPLYRLLYKAFHTSQGENTPKRIVLLVSRPQDVELLIGLHEKTQGNTNVAITYWVVKNCAKRYPGVINELKKKQAVVGMVVSIGHLGRVLNELLSSHVFLSTVESTTARHKLPYIITRLANAAGIATYTMQHGFENVGLTYCDEVHGPEVKFAARTVLTWGPVEGLPAWVCKETRDKAVAVGCPKPLITVVNSTEAKTEGRPVIGVFDNLHWHRYDARYVASFLNHLEEAASQHPELRFVLKSHPDSVRNRSQELTGRLCRMGNVDVADLLGESGALLTTPALLAQALGVITTPSTIALDSALAGVPVAIAGYGLELAYYSPLDQLVSFKDWQGFLERLTDNAGNSQLRQRGELFLTKVLVPGDAAARILNLITGLK
jgi:hypothetical protein